MNIIDRIVDELQRGVERAVSSVSAAESDKSESKNQADNQPTREEADSSVVEGHPSTATDVPVFPIDLLGSVSSAAAAVRSVPGNAVPEETTAKNCESYVLPEPLRSVLNKKVVSTRSVLSQCVALACEVLQDSIAFQPPPAFSRASVQENYGYCIFEHFLHKHRTTVEMENGPLGQKLFQNMMRVERRSDQDGPAYLRLPNEHERVCQIFVDESDFTTMEVDLFIKYIPQTRKPVVDIPRKTYANRGRSLEVYFVDGIDVLTKNVIFSFDDRTFFVNKIGYPLIVDEVKYMNWCTPMSKIQNLVLLADVIDTETRRIQMSETFPTSNSCIKQLRSDIIDNCAECLDAGDKYVPDISSDKSAYSVLKNKVCVHLFRELLKEAKAIPMFQSNVRCSRTCDVECPTSKVTCSRLDVDTEDFKLAIPSAEIQPQYPIFFLGKEELDECKSMTIKTTDSKLYLTDQKVTVESKGTTMTSAVDSTVIDAFHASMVRNCSDCLRGSSVLDKAGYKIHLHVAGRTEKVSNVVYMITGHFINIFEDIATRDTNDVAVKPAFLKCLNLYDREVMLNRMSEQFKPWISERMDTLKGKEEVASVVSIPSVVTTIPAETMQPLTKFVNREQIREKTKNVLKRAMGIQENETLTFDALEKKYDEKEVEPLKEELVKFAHKAVKCDDVSIDDDIELQDLCSTIQTLSSSSTTLQDVKPIFEKVLHRLVHKRFEPDDETIAAPLLIHRLKRTILVHVSRMINKVIPGFIEFPTEPRGGKVQEILDTLIAEEFDE